MARNSDGGRANLRQTFVDWVCVSVDFLERTRRLRREQHQGFARSQGVQLGENAGY